MNSVHEGAWPGRVRFVAATVVLQLTVVSVAQGGDVVAAKLDTGLDDADKTYPVFVRMEDQLFKKGGDFEKFCADNKTARRTQLRAQVLKTLRDKSDAAWQKVKDKVETLQEKGSLQDATRFWIVNGFACTATGQACRALAAEPAVSFVYLQRGPVRQERRELAPKLSDEQEKLYARILKDGQDEADAPLPATLDVPWNLKQLQADQVWAKEKVAGKGVLVAVADSGLLTIPPLLRALWRNPNEQLNGKDDDGNGLVDDLFGYDFAAPGPFVLGDPGVPHGSACAGIIAGRALTDKSLITGVAPRARLMMLRGMGYLRSHEYALAEGADVLSMSYMWVNVELGNYRGVFRLAHEHLAAGGIVSVGGAGNFAQSTPAGKQIALPKDIPCVIAAAGIDEDGKRPAFSSKGPCTWQGVKFYDDFPPDRPLLKPDVTTFNADFPCWSAAAFARQRKLKEVWQDDKNEFGLYIGLRGNSFAGPHVAGVAALMLSANPELPAWEVKRLLEETCKDLGDEGRDVEFGAGLVQALAAVQAARKR